MDILIRHPWLALIPAAMFALAWVNTRRRTVLVASMVWMTYCLYEYGMKTRVLCSGECNIRIDLFPIYAALLLTTAAGVVAWALALRKRGL